MFSRHVVSLNRGLSSFRVVAIQPTLRNSLLLKPRAVRRHLSFFSSETKQRDTDQPQYTLRDSAGARISGSILGPFNELVFTGADFLASLKSANGAKETDEFVIPVAAFELLLTEYDALREESKDFKDKYVRSLAETENVRRRGAKAVEDAKGFAIQGFCKDLLEVADILNMAIDSVKPEDIAAGGKPLKDLHEGVTMTKTVLLKVFEKHGLIADSPQGQRFDPNKHEAVFQVPKEQAKSEPGHIEHVMKIGYLLRDRTVRPAQVGVVRES